MLATVIVGDDRQRRLGLKATPKRSLDAGGRLEPGPQPHGQRVRLLRQASWSTSSGRSRVLPTGRPCAMLPTGTAVIWAAAG